MNEMKPEDILDLRRDIQFIKEELSAIQEQLNTHERLVEKSVNRVLSSVHLRKFITCASSMDTAQFIIEHMPLAKRFERRFDLLDFALKNVLYQNGLYLEFGVFKGKTINHIAEKMQEKCVWGFDSFEGLPETWRTGFDQGVFQTDELPEVRDNVRIVKGYFDTSIPVFKEEHKERCSFLHVDCDLYSSTSTIFELLQDRIVPGTVIVFDEFFNYPGWRNGEYKAFMEFAERCGHGYEYIGYTTNQQVAVRMVQL